VRSTAEVDELAAAVKGNFLAFRDIAETFELERLVQASEQFGGLLTGHNDALERHILRYNARHFLLYVREMLGRETLGKVKIVIKAVICRRPDVKLDTFEPPADGCCHDMRRTMAHTFQVQLFSS